MKGTFPIIIGLLFSGIGASFLVLLFQKRDERKKELFAALKEEYIRTYSPYPSEQESRGRTIKGKPTKEIVALAEKEIMTFDPNKYLILKDVNEYHKNHIAELDARLKGYKEFRTYLLF
jgi:hypothetical protein